jgi:hypothetical protein
MQHQSINQSINHCHKHSSGSSDNGLEGSNWTQEKTVNRGDPYSANFPIYYLGNHNENEIHKACICTLHGKCEKYLIGREERKKK